MPNYLYTDENGQKYTLTEQRLQTLAERGTITPTTPLETDTGHQGLAGQIPGLQFKTAAPSPFAQITQTIPADSGSSNSLFMCMYLIWLLWGVTSLVGVSLFGVIFDAVAVIFILPVCILTTIFIWVNTKDKNTQGDIHGKNILNGIVSYCIYAVVIIIITNGVLLVIAFSAQADPDSYFVTTFAPRVIVGVRASLQVLFIVATILSAIAAGQGEVKRYLLSIRFFQTH